jgi:hypothetical protein
MAPQNAVGPVILAAFTILFATHAGFAGDPPPYPDFTFKREKPPEPGTAKRITVQIDPEEQAEILASRPNVPEASEDDSTGRTPIGRYDWFWTDVPYETGIDAVARLDLAFARLKSEGVTGPRLQVLQDIASANGADILRATIGSRVSPALVLAVIAVESGGRPAAESHKGAQGLMQLMPDTAARFGVTDSLSESQNITGGVAYLDWLLKEFDDDAVLALAGYNAGEGAVRKHGGVPPYAETRDYVPKVLAAYDVARGLCQTRPDLITDACALRLALN